MYNIGIFYRLLHQGAGMFASPARQSRAGSCSCALCFDPEKGETLEREACIMFRLRLAELPEPKPRSYDPYKP